MNELLTITCPLCGRKNECPVETLFEGAIFTCRHCKVQLKLHGHMLQDIQAEIERLKEKAGVQ